jgi:hypothetical protein
MSNLSCFDIYTHHVSRDLFPYFHLVPLEPLENLKFRWYVIDRGCADAEFAEAIWVMCSRDPLFFISTFVFAYDPRDTNGLNVSPFIPYPFQQLAMADYLVSLGNEDIFTDKSRDMGASWFHLLILDWLFLFKQMTSSLCASRVEDLVDKRDDPDSLFWKIDFVHKHLPPFLRPPSGSDCRKSLHFYNPNTGSTIDGCSTNADLGRGGRRTCILLDEFAMVQNGFEVLRATQRATNCRMFNSTPKGVGNAFHAVYKTGIKKIRLHWRNHPIYARGLYSSKHNKLKLLDTDFDWAGTYPEGYTYILDGKIRSPWYDAEYKRVTHPMEIAQELDIDYLGSDFQFFDSDIINEHIKRHSCDPEVVGEVSFDTDNFSFGGFSPIKGGRLALWLELDEDHKPPVSQYVLAADIAAGTGASNSVISIGDVNTSRKVGEFVSPHLQPYELARYAWALAQMFYGAFIIWENNGAGRNFGSMLTGAKHEDKLGYTNVYYRYSNEESFDRRMTQIPGWASTGQTKKILLSDYRRLLSDDGIINPCYDALNECHSYVYTSTGHVAHAGSVNSLDPSGARDNHGDRVIADALLAKMFIEKVAILPDKKEKIVPDNCMLARRLRRDNNNNGEFENGWRHKWTA